MVNDAHKPNFSHRRSSQHANNRKYKTFGRYTSRKPLTSGTICTSLRVSCAARFCKTTKTISDNKCPNAMNYVISPSPPPTSYQNRQQFQDNRYTTIEKSNVWGTRETLAIHTRESEIKPAHVFAILWCSYCYAGAMARTTMIPMLILNRMRALQSAPLTKTNIITKITPLAASSKCCYTGPLVGSTRLPLYCDSLHQSRQNHTK